MNAPQGLPPALCKHTQSPGFTNITKARKPTLPSLSQQVQQSPFFRFPEESTTERILIVGHQQCRLFLKFPKPIDVQTLAEFPTFTVSWRKYHNMGEIYVHSEDGAQTNQNPAIPNSFLETFRENATSTPQLPT